MCRREALGGAPPMLVSANALSSCGSVGRALGADEPRAIAGADGGSTSCSVSSETGTSSGERRELEMPGPLR